ncbi:hypothetical protein QJQ45_011216 [Haematococcus lacustris]|nr:hypothetical protein QJQ45_011216 [Haematococcus lacustris]
MRAARRFRVTSGPVAGFAEEPAPPDKLPVLLLYMEVEVSFNPLEVPFDPSEVPFGAWSQQRDQPVRGIVWSPIVAPRKPPQAPCSSQAATQPAASEPGPSTIPPAERPKCTKAEQAAEPTQPTKGKGQAKGEAAKARPAPQPGRWVGRDCNAALDMQRIGESRWRPLELCWWQEQGKLPAKGKEYPGLGNKRV